MTIRTYKAITPQVGKACYIDPQALVLGDVVLEEHVSVWPMTVIRGDVHSIRIGRCTNIQDNSVLHVTHAGPHTGDGLALMIGNNVTVGHRVILHACTIGDNCLIGMGAIVMDGVEIAENVILGAGSLVPPGKKLAANALYVGNPARKVRDLSTDEIARLEYSAAHYVRLKDTYLKQASG